MYNIELPPAGKTVLVAFVCAVLSAPNTASAGEVEITWHDILDLIDNHPAIAAGRHDVAAARSGVDAAGAVPNPRIEGTVAHGQATDGSESTMEWGLGLSIPLGWLARRGARVDAADAEARTVESENGALRRELVMQLRAMFWELVYEQERVASLTELSAETEALARSVAQRVEQGEVRPVEATRIEVEAEKVAGELEVARSELFARRSQLALWLGVPRDRTLVARVDLTDLPQPMTAERAVEKVRAEHPSLAAAKARVEALEANVTAERRERVPSIELMLFTDHELDRRAYGVGLSLDLPLWNWNTGNVRQAESRAAAAMQQLEVVRLELETVTIDYQSRCRAGVALAARYRDQILPRARSAAQLVERTYQLGEATVLEVIDARRTLLETRSLFLEALVRAQTDCASLRALVGEESR